MMRDCELKLLAGLCPDSVCMLFGRSFLILMFVYWPSSYHTYCRVSDNINGVWPKLAPLQVCVCAAENGVDLIGNVLRNVYTQSASNQGS